MSAPLLVISLSLLGVSAGWQPIPGGGVEYIIQLEPGLLDALREGEMLRSEIPSEAGDVRSYCIRVGQGPVPRIAALAAVPSLPPADPSAKGEPSTGGATPATNAGTAAAKAATGAETAAKGSPPAIEKEDAKPAAPSSESSATTRPWLPLTATLLALFTSLGANVFLGWIAAGTYRRYRTLVARYVESLS